MHILKFILFLTIAMLFTNEHLNAKVYKDFLIIENAIPLKIYDHYQQELTQSQKSKLISGAPLQIINKKELLGDQITTAFHVGLGKNRNYFIINDKSGRILNRKNAGQISVLKNCTVINDSIYIKKSGIIRIKISNESAALSSGSKLIRYFKYKNRYYVRQTSPNVRFGWVKLTANRSWGKLKSRSVEISADNFIGEELRSKILDVFNNGNNIYKQYFDFFNGRTLKSAQPPQWQIELNDNTISARFIPDSLLINFQKSFKYTERQVENLLIGTPYTITMQKNRIFIGKGDK